MITLVWTKGGGDILPILKKTGVTLKVTLSRLEEDCEFEGGNKL